MHFFVLFFCPYIETHWGSNGVLYPADFHYMAKNNSNYLVFHRRNKVIQVLEWHDAKQMMIER